MEPSDLHRAAEKEKRSAKGYAKVGRAIRILRPKRISTSAPEPVLLVDWTKPRGSSQAWVRARATVQTRLRFEF